MKTLTIALALAATAAATAATGCKKTSNQQNPPTPMAKPLETAPTPAPTPAPINPSATTPPSNDRNPVAELPADCSAYKASIDRMNTCDKLPKEQRDALSADFDRQAAKWAALPLESKAQVGQQCKASNDAVIAAAKDVCGW
jgi:hypothetical protein